MARSAGGGFGQTLAQIFTMVGMKVNIGFDAVAVSAGNGGQFGRVGDIGGIPMARYAQVAPMNGFGEVFLIHMGSSFHSLAMAGEANIIVLGRNESARE